MRKRHGDEDKICRWGGNEIGVEQKEGEKGEGRKVGQVEGGKRWMKR